MGTRGLYGLRRIGMDKVTYNHFDSYPDVLGKSVVEFCSQTTEEAMKRFYDKIVLVDETSTPSQDQISFCQRAEMVDTSVGGGTTRDWYCILRGLQGDLAKTFAISEKYGKAYMIDNRGFIEDSLFCEYAYIINLDTHKLEFWVGFQKTPDYTNRYGTHSDGEYYPCRLALEIPLFDTKDVDEVVRRMNAVSQ